MDLAVKDLKRHLGRFLTTVVGVGLLFGTVLAMNGVYRGVVFEGISLIEALNPDLWVVERFRGGPFSEQSTLAEDFHYRVAAVPGGGPGQSLHRLPGGTGNSAARASASPSSATTSSAGWAAPKIDGRPGHQPWPL